MKQLKDYIGKKACVVVTSLEETRKIINLFYEACPELRIRHSARDLYRPEEREVPRHGLCLWQGNITHSNLRFFIAENAELILASDFLEETYEIY